MKYKRSVTVTVEQVANRIHGLKMKDLKAEHLGMHSCPCTTLAEFYLGLRDDFGNLYWPDGKGGNAWALEARG